MSFFKYILFAILAFIIVFAMRGDLAYMIPNLWNYLRSIQFYLGSMYNIFYGYRIPVNPDPSYQYNNSNNFKFTLIIVSLLSLISFLYYIIQQRV